jgi:hypothetical protein
MAGRQKSSQPQIACRAVGIGGGGVGMDDGAGQLRHGVGEGVSGLVRDPVGFGEAGGPTTGRRLGDAWPRPLGQGASQSGEHARGIGLVQAAGLNG